MLGSLYWGKGWRELLSGGCGNLYQGGQFIFGVEGAYIRGVRGAYIWGMRELISGEWGSLCLKGWRAHI